jgi:hypothetical protein
VGEGAAAGAEARVGAEDLEGGAGEDTKVLRASITRLEAAGEGTKARSRISTSLGRASRGSWRGLRSRQELR